MSEAVDERRAQLREALDALRTRVGAACEAVNRDPAEVRLLAVTKTFPATDVAVLADLGVRDFAENRDQEARAKVGEFNALRPDAEVRWHMVGQLQRNKARSVAGWADEVQSVDSVKLVEALSKSASAGVEQGFRSQPLDVLVQVGLDQEGPDQGDPDQGSTDAAAHRGGCPPGELAGLVASITRSTSLRLRGLMTVAPQNMEHSSVFTRLQSIFDQLRAEHPHIDELSAGMSQDLESAIAHGSTCVRVGTALLGTRALTSDE